MRDAGFEFRGGACGCELVAVGEYCRCGCGDTGFGCRGRSIGLALDADAVGDGLDAAYFGCRCGDAGFGCRGILDWVWHVGLAGFECRGGACRCELVAVGEHG